MWCVLGKGKAAKTTSGSSVQSHKRILCCGGVPDVDGGDAGAVVGIAKNGIGHIRLLNLVELSLNNNPCIHQGFKVCFVFNCVYAHMNTEFC